MSLSVDRERCANDCLAAEPVDGCAESFIEIEACLAVFDFWDLGPIDHALHDVSCFELPDLGRKAHVVRVVDLGLVIPTPSLTWEGQCDSLPAKLYCEIPFWDLAVGRAVLAPMVPSLMR